MSLKYEPASSVYEPYIRARLVRRLTWPEDDREDKTIHIMVEADGV